MRSVRRGVLVALVATGCADEPEPANIERQTIGPEGGIVSSHDGVLTIVLQPGSVNEPIEIEIFPSVEPPAIFGPAYRVRPNLELDFDAEIIYRRVLPQDSEGVAVAAIRFDDYLDGAGHWDPLLPVLRVDTSTHEVVGGDDELALYYGLVEDATPDEDTSGTGGADTGGESGAIPLSHAADIQPIWNASCMSGGDGTEAVCHASAADTPLHDLVLEGDAYQTLLGQAVGANLAYVEPGDPDASYLLHKLDGTQLDPDVGGSGSAMPLLLDPLPEDTRAFVRAWIEQGAPP